MNKKIIPLVCLVFASAASALSQSAAEFTEQRVVAAYIQSNLELQAARFKVERSKADQIAARLRPNPAISVTAENLSVSGPTPAGRLYELGILYSETIELGGKRALREKAADATVSAAEASLEDTLRRGVAEVKRLYFDALLARYSVEVATENRQTLEQLVQFNLVRFQEGAIPEIDLLKVRLERLKFDSTVKQAEVGSRQAVIRLLEKLGTTDLTVREIGGELNSGEVNFDLNSLRQAALTERSDVRAAVAEVNASTDRLALEKARGKPDISPFAGYKRVGNDHTLLFGVNLPLKVRDYNQAEITRAEVDIKTAQVRLQLARNHVSAEIEAAYAALQGARELVETFQKELLQQAEDSRAIALAAYEEGGTELLPVLEAQRTRSEVRLQYYKTLFDYQTSLVALELAVGREIQP